MTPPLLNDFGYLGRQLRKYEVLQGSYNVPDNVDPFIRLFISHMKQPALIQLAGPYPTELPLQEYRNYWTNAREHTSCYQGI
jgi:hypothetical protein